MNYDLCDRNLYSDETARRQKMLVFYVCTLILFHLVQWFAFMNAQRKMALEDTHRTHQCKIWAPVIVLFVVVNII